MNRQQTEEFTTMKSDIQWLKKFNWVIFGGIVINIVVGLTSSQ